MATYSVFCFCFCCFFVHIIASHVLVGFYVIVTLMDTFLLQKEILIRWGVVMIILLGPCEPTWAPQRGGPCDKNTNKQAKKKPNKQNEIKLERFSGFAVFRFRGL